MSRPLLVYPFILYRLPASETETFVLPLGGLPYWVWYASSFYFPGAAVLTLFGSLIDSNFFGLFLSADGTII
jgi:hypothetical protein